MDEEKSLQKNDEERERQKNNQTKQNVEKLAKNMMKKKGSLMAPIAHIIMVLAPIIIAIVIIVGVILFFMTMPGMVMDKLKGMFRDLGNAVARVFGADATLQVEDSQIYETLDYLEQMSYDLKGYGFLTDYETAADVEEGEELDDDIGVIRNSEDGLIAKAKSDFIFAYIVSDNYVYTLKNDNIATQNDADSWLGKVVAGIATVSYKVRNFFLGPIYDALGITDGVIDTWGTGLIALYYDDRTWHRKECSKQWNIL